MAKKNLKQNVIEFDNRLTYIVGYRNLYNICILMIGAWCLLVTDQLSIVLGFLLIVMGFKWFLAQARENIDAMDVTDTLEPACQPDCVDAPTSKDVIRI